MERLIYPGIPLVALAAGVAYFVLSSIYEWRWAHDLLRELSTALFIFGALGLSLEPWMRKAVARDVFRAAFGYNFPPDFKDEIARISDVRIICTKHLMQVKIQEIDNDTVRVTLIVERHFQNIGRRPVLQRAMIWVDDWGFTEGAKIIRCTISNSRGTRTKDFHPAKIETVYRDPGIKVQSPRMLLRPQGTVMVMYEYSAVKHNNDQFIEWFLSPTRDPVIHIIQKPPDIEVNAGFGSDLKIKPTAIPDRYELDGVYFPPAVMKVRWWPKAAVANWPPRG
jgi:hypothetical protein